MDDFNNKTYEQKQKYLQKTNKKKARIISTRLLTIIQITVCSVILVTALCIRIFNTDVYKTIKNWYFSNVNNSIIANEDIDNVKHSVVEFFSSGSDLFSGDSVKIKTDTSADNSSELASSTASSTQS